MIPVAPCRRFPPRQAGFSALERDDDSSNRHLAPAYWWSMIFFRKPVSTFRDHALTAALLAVPLMVGIALAAAAEEAKQPNLTFSRWTKVCFTSERTCTTSRDGRGDSGAMAVAAALIEPQGGKRILRVTLSLGMSIKPGTRVIIDQGQPLVAPYVN